ncbi:ras-related protein Rab-18A-like [Hetaerina americana]|uniref:ras-related protein Rab-18A-like n=1 Tax=Hetaerina americana TaxID=62018 RepID=UPI003A7F2036
MGDNEEIKIQFVLLGASGVGKSSLFERYFSNSFTEKARTLVADCKSKIICLNKSVEVQLSVWDTAGMENHQGMMPQYYRGTHGYIVVYDVTDKDSFNYLDTVLVNADTFATVNDNVKIIVGNKIDKVESRVVSRAQGLKYANSHGALFIEASAKVNEAVDHIFEKLVSEILSKNILPGSKSKSDDAIDITKNTPQSTSGGCAC